MLHREDGRKLIVWLPYERVFGFVIGGIGAHYTMVEYTKNGIVYEVLIESDEFELMEDTIEYDDSDD